jgi:hypothetical protein
MSEKGNVKSKKSFLVIGCGSIGKRDAGEGTRG